MKKLYITCVLGLACLAATGQTFKPAEFVDGTRVGADNKVRIDVLSNGGEGGSSKVMRRGNVNYSSQIRIGSTYYDLQTNYAMPHRLVLGATGDVFATWTTSPNDVLNYPQRGSGFNYRNTSGTWDFYDSSKVETAGRTGWPNIGLLSNGNSFIIGHVADQGSFYMSKSTNPGERPGNSVYLTDLAEGGSAGFKPIWARMANNGDTIHMVYSYTDSANPGEKRAPTRKGIFAPMVYSRSLDGGTNWDIKHIMLPGYDSTITNNGGADQYAIDCRGNTVAIVNADRFQGVIGWKSTDFGNTFTRIMVDSFPYAPYTSGIFWDTVETNDGTVDVILDKNNDMHVFWALDTVYTRIGTVNGVLDTFMAFTPSSQGIVYWNETTKTKKTIALGSDFDYDQTGYNELQPTTTAPLSGGNLPSGYPTVARLGFTCAMRQPNASIDDNGNIYCVFSVPIEQDISDLVANYRDLGVVYSKDGGATWGKSQNITQILRREDDFPSTARRANGFLHVMWQHDEFCGTNLQNNSGAVGNHPVVLNAMLYQAIPVNEILNNNIGMLWYAGVDAPNTGEVMVVEQNYPNPFSGSTNVVIYLTKPGDVQVTVRNMSGAVVKSDKVSGLQRGNHIIGIDGSTLPAGIYTYSLTSGGSTVSKTMVIK